MCRPTGGNAAFGGFDDVVAVFLAYMDNMETHGFFKIVGDFLFRFRTKTSVDFNVFTDELLACSMPRPQPSSATEQSSYSSRVTTFLPMVACKVISRRYLKH